MKCLGCGKAVFKTYGNWAAGYTCSHACNETYIKEFKRNVQKPQHEAARVAKRPFFQVNHDSEGRY